MIRRFYSEIRHFVVYLISVVAFLALQNIVYQHSKLNCIIRHARKSMSYASVIPREAMAVCLFRVARRTALRELLMYYFYDIPSDDTKIGSGNSISMNTISITAKTDYVVFNDTLRKLPVFRTPLTILSRFRSRANLAESINAV